MTGTDAVAVPQAQNRPREDLADLYTEHRDGLVRLAALLLDDVALAEDVVQDAYIKVFARWTRIRDERKALAYLRRAVVNTARSALRRRVVARRHETSGLEDVPSAEESAQAALDRDRVVAALRQLPRRQREAVVLRYYGGLQGSEIAKVMGCTVGSVKAYLSRGVAALTHVMQGEER